MSEPADWAGPLAAGLAELGLDLAPEMVRGLLDYVALLQKWNRTYNLTAIREPEQMISHHLLDSLAVLPVLRSLEGAGDTGHENSVLARRRQGPWRLADVGSGAGLPGLVLALVCPGWSVTSVEAVEKKAAFQRQACIELGLKNVTVVSGRVEKLAAGSADAVISRAFASLADFVNLAGHLAAPTGKLLAMKGVLPTEELAQLPPGWRSTAIHPLQVPGLSAQRHLIVLEKA